MESFAENTFFSAPSWTIKASSEGPWKGLCLKSSDSSNLLELPWLAAQHIKQFLQHVHSWMLPYITRKFLQIEGTRGTWCLCPKAFKCHHFFSLILVKWNFSKLLHRHTDSLNHRGWKGRLKITLSKIPSNAHSLEFNLWSNQADAMDLSKEDPIWRENLFIYLFIYVNYMYLNKTYSLSSIQWLEH